MASARDDPTGSNAGGVDRARRVAVDLACGLGLRGGPFGYRKRVAAAYDLHTTSKRLDDEDGGIDADEWDAVAPAESHPSERDEDTQ